MRIVVDTNVLLQNPNYLDKYENCEIVIPLVVVQELDRQKSGDNGELAYKARTAIRFIKEHEEFQFSMEHKRDTTKYNDDVIVECAVAQNASLLTGDFNMQLKAKALGIDVLEFSEDKELYKGYRVLELHTNEEEDSAWVQHFYESPEDNSLEMNPNEYLIIKDLDAPLYETKDGEEELIGYKTLDIRRWNGEKFVGLKSPDFPKGKGIKPLNDLQRCALDILEAPQSEIPIKVILGTYGSGKSFMATKTAIHKTVTKGEYSKIILIREPTNESSIEIGYLPGSIDDKMGMYYDSVVQHLDMGASEAEMLEKNGMLEKAYLGHIKGRSINSAIVLVDEVQDLTMKGIKLVGSRLEKSTVIFVGDINQVNKKIYNSGIAEFIKKTICEKQVGVIVLDDDVRSEESKLFANL